jgi:hypothetical protein
MAPYSRRWGSVRGPSRQLLAAFGRTYRPALEDRPKLPGRLPQERFCSTSTLQPPNDSCRQLRAMARQFKPPAQERVVRPLKFKVGAPVPSGSSSNVGAFAALGALDDSRNDFRRGDLSSGLDLIRFLSELHALGISVSTCFFDPQGLDMLWRQPSPCHRCVRRPVATAPFTGSDQKCEC